MVMLSTDGNLQFVCPVGILQRERMEGGDGGRELSATSTQNGDK